MINKCHTRYTLKKIENEIQKKKYKTQKRWIYENRKKENLKKSKRNRVSCFSCGVFTFLSSTVEVDGGS